MADRVSGGQRQQQQQQQQQQVVVEALGRVPDAALEQTVATAWLLGQLVVPRVSSPAALQELGLACPLLRSLCRTRAALACPVASRLRSRWPPPGPLLRSLAASAHCARLVAVVASPGAGARSLRDALVASCGLVDDRSPGDSDGDSDGLVVDNGSRSSSDGGLAEPVAHVLLHTLAQTEPLPCGATGITFAAHLVAAPRAARWGACAASALLRAVDGALVVVDAAPSAPWTPAPLAGALAERVRPLLLLNKLDALLGGPRADTEAAYSALALCVARAQAAALPLGGPWLGGHALEPQRGAVLFGSARGRWAFALPQWAELHARRLGAPADRLCELLWGDHWYDPAARRWSATPTAPDGTPLPRGFCALVLRPIARLARAAARGRWAAVRRMLADVGVALPPGAEALEGQRAADAALSAWLPLGAAVMRAVVHELPSPAEAQLLRWGAPEGDGDDAAAAALRACDASGPLLALVARMAPSTEPGRCYALCRVLSGTLSASAHCARLVAVVASPGAGARSLRDALVASCGLVDDRSPGDSDGDSDGLVVDNGSRSSSDGGLAEPVAHVLLHTLAQTEPLPCGATGITFAAHLVAAPRAARWGACAASALLRAVDGALVVVDAAPSAPWTPAPLAGALAERVRPLLLLNKLDALLGGPRADTEAAYSALALCVARAQAAALPLGGPWLGGHALEPQRGAVLFGSARGRWAFALPQWAELHARRLGAPADRLCELLWGDHWYDPAARRWSATPTAPDGTPLPRGFCALVLRPIARLARAAARGRWAAVRRMLADVGVALPPGAEALEGQRAADAALSAWLPLGAAVMRAVVHELPSPAEAQLLRWGAPEGDGDDAAAAALRACDASGPLLALVARMAPSTEPGRCYALCRVLSGTLSPASRFRVLSPDDDGDSDSRGDTAAAQRTLVASGAGLHAIDDAPAGSLVSVEGLDARVQRTATLAGCEVVDGAAVLLLGGWPPSGARAPRAAVGITVEPEAPADLPRVLEGLKRLWRTDEHCRCEAAPSGEHVVYTASDRHMRAAMADLRELCGCALRFGAPFVHLREAPTAPSDRECTSKTPNRHSVLCMAAAPLPPGLADALESAPLRRCERPAMQELRRRHGWPAEDAVGRVWSFGTDPSARANALVERTRAVQFLGEIRDAVCVSFEWATREGPLCDEPVRGAVFSLLDAVIVFDSAHRISSQFIPAARRCLYASLLTASPVLLEPVVAVQVPSALPRVAALLAARRAVVADVEEVAGSASSPLAVVSARLPVRQSFGLLEELEGCAVLTRAAGGGWQRVEGDVRDPESQAGRLVGEVRRRKGLKEGIPELQCFLDKRW
eukprot:m51a1_g5373 hypothetical protein (1336) ;mRNA; f:533594-537713